MKIEVSERVHTVTWDDPRKSRRDASAMSGIDYLTAVREGRIQPPPAARLIGYRICEVEQGRVVFELEPAEYHYNPFATVHGGVMGILLDSAMTAAVLSTLPVGVACATLEMKINFVRPATDAVGVMRGEGRVIHAGASIATAEGKLVDRDGKLYAHAVTTCSIQQVGTAGGGTQENAAAAGGGTRENGRGGGTPENAAAGGGGTQENGAAGPRRGEP